MKNELSFDPIFGSVGSSFFPVNIFMLPFSLIVILSKNKKINETLNKLQYFVVLMIYLSFVTCL